MSAFQRKLILTATGILAGLAAWPFAELTLWLQSSFPSYLILSIVMGGVFGIVMGGFFGSTDGLILSTRGILIHGLRRGLFFGLLGGVAGFLVAQAAIFLLGEYLIHSQIRFQTLGLPLARALGWAALGIFVGMIEGIRSRSLAKLRVGVLGGVIGGLLGGLALEYIRILIPAVALARLIGLVLFGAALGLCYSLVEAHLSYGVLTLLNGRHKGRDFLINTRQLSVGKTHRDDIQLEGYRDVRPGHARLEVRGHDVTIRQRRRDGAVFANDDRIRDHILKSDDVIQIGTAKLLYHY